MEETNQITNQETSQEDVDVAIYRLSDTISFFSYTATWCNPCKKIKPFVVELMEDFELIENTKMKKEHFKKYVNKFIPFFVVIERDEPPKNKEDYYTCEVGKCKIRTIQTSDNKEFAKFLINDDSIVLDEEF